MPLTQRNPAAPDKTQIHRHYSVAMDGFVHASHGPTTPTTVRHPAVVLISACGAPFRVVSGSCDLRCAAAVVGPQVPRALDASGVTLLSFNISPQHRAFPGFSQTFRGVVRALRRERFSPWDDLMRRTAAGEARLDEATELFNVVTSAVLNDHDVAGEPDPRLGEALALIDANVDLPAEQLAAQVGLTVHGLSHLFNDQLGMSVRAYQSWLRTSRAWQLFAREKNLTLTEVAHLAGFSDSAHMSRTWREAYGVSPSFMRSRSVRVIR